MLTARPEPGKLRVARNLVPLRDGSLAVRPAARQVVAGAASQVVAWGNRLLVQQGGRLKLWDGALHDLGSCGPTLDGAPFQALTDLGAREDRLYFGDGLHPLRYVVAEADGWSVHDVVNTCLDPQTSEPLEVPVPIAVGVWAGRLWVSTGSNFVQHSENDDPSYWNPLWTIDCQGAEPGRVLALLGAGDALLVGMNTSLWAVTGKSQFDFQRTAVGADGGGVAGAHCLAADGAAAWWLGPLGVWTAGAARPLSEPVQGWFAAGVAGSLAVDRPRRRVLACVNGRGLAGDVNSGAWAEFCPGDCYGVFASADRAGWFGPDGVWVLGADADPWTNAAGRVALDDAGDVDLALDGTAATVAAVAEAWPEIPNKAGNGRALLNRVRFEFLAAPRAVGRAEILADALVVTSDDLPVRSAAPDWDGVGRGPVLVGDWAPVAFEVVPRAQGRTFAVRLTLAGRVQLRAFALEFRGGSARA